MIIFYKVKECKTCGQRWNALSGECQFLGQAEGFVWFNCPCGSTLIIEDTEVGYAAAA